MGKKATCLEIVQIMNQARCAIPVGKKATSPEIVQKLKVRMMTTNLTPAASSVEGRATLHVTVVSKSAIAVANLGILPEIVKTATQSATSVTKLVILPVIALLKARRVTTVERRAT